MKLIWWENQSWCKLVDWFIVRFIMNWPDSIGIYIAYFYFWTLKLMVTVAWSGNLQQSHRICGEKFNQQERHKSAPPSRLIESKVLSICKRTREIPDGIPRRLKKVFSLLRNIKNFERRPFRFAKRVSKAGNFKIERRVNPLTVYFFFEKWKAQCRKTKFFSPIIEKISSVPQDQKIR